MRIRGQVIGAFPTTKTRRSGIFRWDGFEAVWTVSSAASASRSLASPRAPAPAAAIPADLKKERRPTRASSTGFMEGPPGRPGQGAHRLTAIPGDHMTMRRPVNRPFTPPLALALLAALLVPAA